MIRIIKITVIINIIRIIKIIKINKITKMIKIIKSNMSCMSFFFGGQWSTDKILSALGYIFKVLFPVCAGINHSVIC